MAYLDPQEKIWGGTGQSFDIPDLHEQNFTHMLSPYEGIYGFTAAKGTFHGTLFRFPLRNAKSYFQLSNKVYSIEELNELLKALKEEAKFLLIFLRSVNNIEVYKQTNARAVLSFRVCIREQKEVAIQRKQFMDKIKRAHKLPDGISKSIELVSDFHVQVTDYTPLLLEEAVSHLLTCVQVGSPDGEVLTLAKALEILPCVGTALELSDSSNYSDLCGRIFCFLPMPVESSSPLPVHVNGTFGLNDDRRTIKWMSLERRNDQMAEWNTLLVSRLLPQCYFRLLVEAQSQLKPFQFYYTFPVTSKVKETPWEDLLQPFFYLLFQITSVFTERSHIFDAWIKPCDGVYLLQETQLPEAVHEVLSNCDLKLVRIPDALLHALKQYSGTTITMISPNFTKAQLQRNPNSYRSASRSEKLEILQYCLLDDEYEDQHASPRRQV